MATKKTTIAAEIKVDSSDASKSVGDLKRELGGVGTAAEGSIAQLKELKKQLKNTAAGSEDFKKLYNQIDDLEDKIKASKNVSKDWIDTLESAGGPIGMIGGALNKVKVATESFGGALKASGIGLLVSLIGGLAAAFASNEEAMKKLQPVLTGFGRILNGVLGAMQPLIDAFINMATKALPYVSDGFRVAYSALASFLQGVGLVGSAVKKFISGDFSGAWDDAKKSVTEFGKRYDDASKGFIKGSQELTDKEKEQLNQRQKDRQAANDAMIAEEQRVQDQLLKDEIEAYEKRKKLLSKLTRDPIGSDGMTAKEREAQKQAELERHKYFQDEIDKLNGPEKQAAGIAVLSQNLATQIDLEQQAAEAKKKIAEQERNYRVGAAYDIADATMALSSIVGEQTAAGKALGIASALINTYVGASEVIRAKSVLPEPFGTIQKIASVATIIATGLKTVKSITAVQVPSTKGSSGGGGGAISMPSAASVAAPLTAQAATTTLNQGQVNQIGNVAARAFVVESDVSGNQERIQRLNRAARIN
jgi:hypothetical protein